MHLEIVECRDLAHKHAAFISQAPITKEGINIDETHDIVIWTDASAKGKQQRGPSWVALVFQTVNNNGQVVWEDATFGVTGQRSIHEVELLAVVYALRFALDILMA